MKQKYEIREVDGMNNGECWYWNTSCHIADMETAADNLGRAVRRFLRDHCGITFKVGKTTSYFDGGVYEIQERSGCPIFAAIPID